MIRQLFQQGLSKSEISRRLDLDRKTVRAALKETHAPTYERTVVVGSKLDPFKSYIDSRLESYNLSSQKIYREILNQGFDGKYGIVNFYAQKLKEQYYTKAVMRFETMPGEQAQVDWGYFGEFYDYESKKLIRLCCFLMILGFSRMRFIHFFDGDNTDNFLLGHNLAFEYFGGYTKEMLYDNLKSVVIKRAFKQKDSEFNKKFIDFSGYYGFKPILARPYRPQTKGKVENTVRFVREDFFKGEEFSSLKDINEKAKLWLTRVNTQIHATTHEKPIERLKKEGLILLTKKYDLSKIYYRKVLSDCHFSFRGNFYSVSPEYACKEITIKQVNEDSILVYYRDNLITHHNLELKFKGGYITCPSHFVKLRELVFNYANRKPKQKEKIKPLIEDQEFVPSIRFNPARTIEQFAEVQTRDLQAYQEVV